jgi:hypothetical protein
MVERILFWFDCERATDHDLHRKVELYGMCMQYMKLFEFKIWNFFFEHFAALLLIYVLTSNFITHILKSKDYQRLGSIG